MIPPSKSNRSSRSPISAIRLYLPHMIDRPPPIVSLCDGAVTLTLLISRAAQLPLPMTTATPCLVSLRRISTASVSTLSAFHPSSTRFSSPLTVLRARASLGHRDAPRQPPAPSPSPASFTRRPQLRGIELAGCTIGPEDSPPTVRRGTDSPSARFHTAGWRRR